jgi:hypothetical protein
MFRLLTDEQLDTLLGKMLEASIRINRATKRGKVPFGYLLEALTVTRDVINEWQRRNALYGLLSDSLGARSV